MFPEERKSTTPEEPLQSSAGGMALRRSTQYEYQVSTAFDTTNCSSGPDSLVVQVVLEEADHHLIPVLLAPGDILGGIGVVRVGRGVVVMNNEFELGPFG